MKINKTILPNCHLIDLVKLNDSRGYFVKTFHDAFFRNLGIHFNVKEEFHSYSRRGVLRGMHFQKPPFSHDKLVTCSNGHIIDVVLDLRSGANFGKYSCVELQSSTPQAVFVPSGVAHGFLTLSEGAVVHYQTSKEHNPTSDSGVHWDSFGFNWSKFLPKCDFIISERDVTLPKLVELKTHF